MIPAEQNDFLLLDRLFGDLAEGALPITFRLGGTAYRGVPADFSPTVRKRSLDDDRVETVVAGKNADGVSVRAAICIYRDFPVCEWQVFFRNDSAAPSEILSDPRAMDLLFPAKTATLHHGNGDTRDRDGFAFRDDPVGEEPIVLSPLHGTSCEGAFPYLRLCTDSYIATVAVGWSGQWQASFRREADGIRGVAGQRRMHSRLLPGEEFCTPRMTVLLSGGTDSCRAMNLWRRWYLKHILPKQNGQNLPPKACFHVAGLDGPEFTGATTETQTDGLRQYLNRGLKPDLWWIDAGWYPCDKRWSRTGTWEADEARFPGNGLAPIGELCRENGVEFLLWFEPERVTAGTWLAEHRPQWLLRPKDPAKPDSLLDLGNREACDWLIGHVSSLIRDWRVSVYRQDFNRVDAMEIWMDNESDDRVGALENLHIQGYWRYWDALLQKNPGLWIDACASGGRRNDLETMRRSAPLHYTDVGYGEHPLKQFQHQMMFEWIPYFRAHTLSWDNDDGTYEPRREHTVCDEFSYQNALTPAVTVTTPPWAEEDEIALAKKMLPVWRRAAELELRGDYYPVTRSEKSEGDLYAVEFSDETQGDGMLHVIRNTLCQREGITARLHVDPAARYLLENGVTGERQTVPGAELADGFSVSLPRRSGVVWFYRKLN